MVKIFTHLKYFQARYEPSVPIALNLVTEVGRTKFLEPLYKDLYEWEEKRQLALNTFRDTKNHLMTNTAEIVEKALHIKQ